MIGTVKWFSTERAYGFITPDDRSCEEVFIHANMLKRAGLETLQDGARVEFEIERNIKSGKLRAASIALVLAPVLRG